MLNRIAIRPRLDADVPACVEGLRLVHDADRYPMRWPADPAAFVTAPSTLAAWVAEDDGAIVGHALLRSGAGHDDAVRWSAATGRPDRGHGLVARVWVVPGAQGRGLGRALLETASAEARRLDLWPVLDVMVHDATAVALYERLGWRRVAERDFVFSDGTRAPMYCYVAPAAG
jgi:ribosomal protein S18 acetylase RimI-like enzyme